MDFYFLKHHPIAINMNPKQTDMKTLVSILVVVIISITNITLPLKTKQLQQPIKYIIRTKEL